jgi:hypothetical protein
MNITKDDFKAYTDWQKHILATQPKLPKGRKRVTLIAYCFAMASHGRCGLGCFASDVTIGKEIGIANRDIVGKYRRLALDLGWFVRTGERRGRGEVLNIAMSSDVEETPVIVDTSDIEDDTEEMPAVQPAKTPVAGEHNAWFPEFCKTCSPLIESGEYTQDELWDIHEDGQRATSNASLY